MKILYCCRLYSGFEKSISDGVWDPRGSPTSYKLVDTLDAGPDEPRFIFTIRHRENGLLSLVDISCDKEVTLSGLKNPFLLLHAEDILPAWLGSFRPYLNLLRQGFAVIREFIKYDPDIVYVDRANVLLGAVLARIFRARVVLRVMGVTPAMRSFKDPGLWNRIALWSYASPFAGIICSEDGSGGLNWIREQMNSSTSVISIVNGVEFSPYSDQDKVTDNSDSMNVLFIARRLTAIKGSEEFLDTCLRLSDDIARKINFIIVGTGGLEETLRGKLRRSGNRYSIKMLGDVPHRDIRKLFSKTDVYVSLNKMGSLSNSNLEALSSGVCCIMLEDDSSIARDESILNKFPSDAICFVTRKNLTNSLSECLTRLLNNPKERLDRARLTRKYARDLIPTWDARINREIEFLKGLLKIS